MPEFDAREKPEWCPGCGDYSILAAFKKALIRLEFEPERVVLVSGVGDGSKLPQWVHCYGFHSLHGRAIPVATGIKLANRMLTVFVVEGDGDCYGEGGNHLIHAARRNTDITCIVCDNQVYGLTTGQASPTSDKGFVTKSTPGGVGEMPVNPLALAIASGATFVSRGYAGKIDHLSKLIVEAVRHGGFSLVDVLQPCVTWNKVNTASWYSERVYELKGDYDPSNKVEAFKKSLEWGDRIPLGVVYKERRATFEEGFPRIGEGPPASRDIGGLMKGFY